jgi:hypothetical protein
MPHHARCIVRLIAHITFLHKDALSVADKRCPQRNVGRKRAGNRDTSQGTKSESRAMQLYDKYLDYAAKRMGASSLNGTPRRLGWEKTCTT